MKKLLSTTIFSGLLILATPALRAQAPVQTPDSSRAQGSATIKYLGTEDDEVLFNITYSNPQGSFFNLIVRDQDGSELYQHSFHDRFFNKLFRLPRTDKGRLSFIIRSGKDEIVKNFGIDTRMIEDVVVTQLR